MAAARDVTASDLVPTQGPPGPLARRPRADRWLVAAAVLPVAGYLVAAVARIGYPYELEWMEGGSVEWARHVTTGDLYGPPSLENTPWAYPPGFPAVSALVASVTGWGFLPLRLVSVVASLVVLAALAALVTQATGRRVAGVAAAGVYAVTYVPSGLAADVGRVDSLVLALTLLGVVAVARARTPAAGLVAAMVLVAATATKQTAVVVAVVALCWLAVRRRRVGFVALASYAVLLALGLLAAQAWTGGWFVDYVVLLLPGHELAGRYVLAYWVLDLGLLLGPTLLALWWGGRGRVPGPHGPPTPWLGTRGSAAELLCCAAGGLLLAGWLGRVHEGGAANTLMPGYAGVALLVGWTVGRSASARLGTALAAGLVVQTLVFGPALVRAVPAEADHRAGAEVIAAVSRLPGRVVLLDHPHYLTLAGKPAGAHLVAVSDLQRGADSRARHSLQLQLATSALASVDAVVLDRAVDAQRFGPELDRDFVRLPTAGTATPGVFDPPGGISGRPSVVYLRRGIPTPADLAPLLEPR